MSFDDQTAKLVSELDQMETGLTNLARMTGSICKALIESGITHTQAEQLVQDWWRIQLWKAMYPDTPPTTDVWYRSS